MKTKLNLFSIFAIVLASLLLYACQKDLSLSPEPAVQEGIQLDDDGVLAKAQEWYRNNMERVSKAGDIDVRLLSPDWDNYVLNENGAGQPWISIPLQNHAHDDAYMTELSLVIDQKGRVNGIIKEFRDNPYIGDSELTIYLGNGKIYEKGMYRHKRNSLVVNRTGSYYRGKDKLHRIAYGHKASGERRSLGFLKSSGGDGVAWELEIEEVIVPPPGGNPGDPWEEWWEWDDWGTGDGDDEGSGDNGNGETEPNSGGGLTGGGGGNPTGPSKPSIQQVKDYTEDKPFAFIAEDIPCEIIEKWLATAKHEAQQAQLSKLGSITGVTWEGGNMVTEENIGWILDINDAHSKVVNMDYFPITINQLPIVNGQRLTAPQFLEYIRKNINNFVDTNLSEFTPYNAYGVDDNMLWNSNNPLNAIVGIKIAPYMGVRDNGSVIVTQHSSTGWTFTTVHDPLYGDHPVSGNRDFGYEQNVDGSYTFYTRGVDRLTNWSGTALQYLNERPFNTADQLWRSFQIKIVNYVRQNGGAALWETLTTTEEVHRPNWSEVKDVLDGKKPLSTLSKDCDD